MGFWDKYPGLKRLLKRLVPMIKWREVDESQIPPQLMASLAEAHREWREASAFFEAVADPDLIDYSIFLMGACEQKYSYLLKQVRQTGGRVALEFKAN